VTIYYAGLAGAILFAIAGQLALKSGAVASASLAAQFVDPRTMLGLAFYALSALCYIVALKKIPVSVAYPSIAAGYAIVAILAHFLWNEPFGWPQLAGLGLIACGVLLIHQY
jgi:multidrug transporter EmrE-like cation transporter